MARVRLWLWIWIDSWARSCVHTHTHIHTDVRQSIGGDFYIRSSAIRDLRHHTTTDAYRSSRDADPPGRSISLFLFQCVRARLVSARVIAFHKCRTKFFEQHFRTRNLQLFWLFICCSLHDCSDNYLAWSTHIQPKFVYCLQFDNFALAAVDAHTPTHKAIDSAWRICIENSAKTSSIAWPVERICYCGCVFELHSLYITWYLIVCKVQSCICNAFLK